VDITSDDLTLRATGSVLAFAGFRTLYIEGTDEPAKDDKDRLLPALKVMVLVALQLMHLF